LTLTTV